MNLFFYGDFDFLEMTILVLKNYNHNNIFGIVPLPKYFLLMMVPAGT